MNAKLLLTSCLSAVAQVCVSGAEADPIPIKEQIAAIDRQLLPIQVKAVIQPHVKAEWEKRKAAYDKFQALLEAEIIKDDPKAKDLLDEKKRLIDELGNRPKDSLPMKDRIAAIDGKLESSQRKALAEPEVKEAVQKLKIEDEKYHTVLEEEMIKQDPQAGEFLDRRKQLQMELNKPQERKVINRQTQSK